ncbi:MAG TPA: RHS repeat-associated core domain-containing protein [Gammaproteobacteria bacterium]|nr:RHS repeat-associated core domain-containing protein [Gammaproteobacteria bacterium]
MNKTMIKLIALLALLLAGNAQAAQSVTFYHHDALGSVIAKSDEDGYLYLNEEYQPYGEKIYAADDFFGGSDDWYTGKNYSEDLDLTYFGARWYDAKQGRFLSIDPAPVSLASIHSFNRYAYAFDNPYKYVDPDGEKNALSTFLSKAGNRIGTLKAGFSQFKGARSTPYGPASRLDKLMQRINLRGEFGAKKIEVSAKQHPEAAKHIQDAQAAGHPKTLTIDRSNAAANRNESLRGVPTKKGLDRDEYPPAMFKEGGAGASVRHINIKDNRGSGSCIGAQCSGLPDGARVRIESVD